MSAATPFRRELGLLDLTMASFGGIIGASWLLGAQRAAQIAGPAAVASWVIGGVAVLLLGLVNSELSAMMPEAGGMVVFPLYSHGPLVGVLVGWATWLAYAAIGPYEADAVVQYASNYLPGIFDPQRHALTSAGTVVAALILVGFFVINVVGVRTFARVHTPLTLFKLVVPALTALTLLAAAFHPGNWTVDGGLAPHGSAGVLAAVSTAGVIPAFAGFRQAIGLAGEARHPQRDIPRAIVLALLCAGVLYVLLQISFIGAVPPYLIARGWDHLSFTAPYVELAVLLGLIWLANLLRLDAVLSPAGTGLVYTSTSARVAYALSEHGFFPPALGRIHPVYRVPHVALFANLAAGLLILLPFPSWASLAGVVTDGILLTYLTGPVTALALRRTSPDARRPIRLPALRLIAPAAFAAAGLALYWTGWPTVGEVLIVSLSGLVLYAAYAWRHGFRRADLRAASWLVGYEIFLTVISCLGSFGGRDLIPFGLDMLLVALASLGAFVVGVRTALDHAPLPPSPAGTPISD